MKKILCFGDSNTFGFNPNNFSRYDKNIRWSGILAKNFEVIEAGCNNRSCFNNIKELNGLYALPKLLNNDLDCIILQIGINDLQFQYGVSLEDFEKGLEKLIQLINPKIKTILLCPNIINESILSSCFSSLFDTSSIEKSKHLPKIYERISSKYNCSLINLNDVAIVSAVDGLHYDIQNHKLIADKIISQFYQTQFP